MFGTKLLSQYLGKGEGWELKRQIHSWGRIEGGRVKSFYPASPNQIIEYINFYSIQILLESPVIAQRGKEG